MLADNAFWALNDSAVCECIHLQREFDAGVPLGALLCCAGEAGLVSWHRILQRTLQAMAGIHWVCNLLGIVF